MKEIELNKGFIALVDDKDYEWINQWHWFVTKYRKSYYAKRSFRLNGEKHPRQVYMHREILRPPKGMVTDHKDHNGLNNQRNNLRICTKDQNNYNIESKAMLGYKGIYPTPNGKVCSRIKINNKLYHIGIFNTPVEAAKAFDIVAKKHRGEFANLNFKE